MGHIRHKELLDRMIAVGLAILLGVLIIFLPLIIYTFLVFPNFDGIMQNVHWYTYDKNSQHFLYWAGFWLIVLFGSRGVVSGSQKKETEVRYKKWDSARDR